MSEDLTGATFSTGAYQWVVTGWSERGIYGYPVFRWWAKNQYGESRSFKTHDIEAMTEQRRKNVDRTAYDRFDGSNDVDDSPIKHPLEWFESPEHPEDIVTKHGELHLVGLVAFVERYYSTIQKRTHQATLNGGVVPAIQTQHEGRVEAWLDQAQDWLPRWYNGD